VNAIEIDGKDSVYALTNCCTRKPDKLAIMTFARDLLFRNKKKPTIWRAFLDA